MVKGLIGKKINMTQGFDSHGRAAPITRVLVEPNFVMQIKTAEADGYKAVQLAAGESKRAPKPLLGRIKKANLSVKPTSLREVQFDGDIKTGQEVRVEEVFGKGSLVDVIGISKGKGFAGVVKRYGFAGGPRTHGQSDRERAGGSIGATTTPGRVFKGTRMAGHMGAERVKIQGLEILDIDKESYIVNIKGSVPGSSGSLVLIEKSKKKKRKYHEPEIPLAPAVGGKEDKVESSEAAEVSSGQEQASSPSKGEGGNEENHGEANQG